MWPVLHKRLSKGVTQTSTPPDRRIHRKVNGQRSDSGACISLPNYFRHLPSYALPGNSSCDGSVLYQDYDEFEKLQHCLFSSQVGERRLYNVACSVRLRAMRDAVKARVISQSGSKSASNPFIIPYFYFFST